jgi:polyphosphate kinase
MKYDFIPKEISWLSFNECVLEEASNERVPLKERIRFLGIFSSNLDEFFRIRVATLRQLAQLKKRGKEIIGRDPREIIKKIEEIVFAQNDRFSSIYEGIIKELNKEKIYIVNEQECTPSQGDFIRSYFQRRVHRRLFPILIKRQQDFPELRDQSIYLFVVLSKNEGSKKPKLALIEIPTQFLPRFIILPETDGRKYIMLLDDIIRFCLGDIFAMFEYDRFEAYTIKLTRDAEIDVDVDFSESFIKKISKSIQKRKEGAPVRLVYDSKLPRDYLDFIVTHLKLSSDESLIPGGRYHNFRDFMDFPNVGPASLEYAKMPPLTHPALKTERTMLAAIRKQDILLFYPYHSFDAFIDLLREAAIDPKVLAIKITVYRAAKNSSVLNALINAVKNGKQVTAILELQARFDEEANISWANRLREEGVVVNYGVPGLKVHAKLCLVVRKEKKDLVNYAIVSTGNFNEDTARTYTDHCLFTADPRISSEVKRLFDYFESMYKLKRFENLVVSPFGSRDYIMKLVDDEIAFAAKGKPASIILKLNHLADDQIIQKLYEASSRGVKIRIIVRGMISLVPGIPGVSENISAIRIIDRFLEHTRVFIFGNGGAELYFISSADFMQRNLDKRIEVICPIYSKDIKQQLRETIELQLKDTSKARVLGVSKAAKSAKPEETGVLRSQVEIYTSLKRSYDDNAKERSEAS